MPAAPDRSSGGQPNDVGLSAITMLVICANLAWTALYVNSDSPAAAIFPLLLGLGILERRPDGSRLADTPFVKKIAACKMHYCALAWGVMLFVGVAVCVSLARAAEGIALDVQLAASNGEVIGAGFCGSLTCELPPMRFVKASGMATNYAFCNTTSIGAVECDGDGTALQGIFLEVEFSGSPASENNQVSRITDLLFEMRDFDNSVQLSLDDTMCPDGFSFGFWRHGLFAWDVWHVRCNGWVLHALVAAGTIEVGRESSASQGVTCGSYQRTDIAHILGKRGVKGVWALTGESIRAIDDGLTVLFVGQALGGVDHVIQAIRDIGVQSDEDATILDTLLEIRNDGSNGTILSGTERSCFVGGGGDSITIDEANNQDVVAAVENSTDEYFEEVFSFSTFTWVTEAKAFNDGFTVADRRDGASMVLAWVSVVVLGVSGLLFFSLLCLSCFWYTKNELHIPNVGDVRMYDQFTALMTVSADLAIISGSGGAAAAASLALLLAVAHGVTLLLYLLLTILVDPAWLNRAS